MSNIPDAVIIFGAKYLYLVVVIIAMIWFLTQSSDEQKKGLTIFCICLPLIFIAAYIAGRLYYNPLPFVLGHFVPLIQHKPDNGFPSHHTLLVSTIAAIIFLFSKRIGILLWFLTFFVGFSRIYAGVHHPIDIIAGALIPAIVVTLIYFLFAKRYLQKAQK